MGQTPFFIYSSSSNSSPSLLAAQRGGPHLNKRALLYTYYAISVDSHAAVAAKLGLQSGQFMRSIMDLWVSMCIAPVALWMDGASCLGASLPGKKKLPKRIQYTVFNMHVIRYALSVTINIIMHITLLEHRHCHPRRRRRTTTTQTVETHEGKLLKK